MSGLRTTLALCLIASLFILPVCGQESTAQGPTSEKAQKSYKEGLEYLHRRMNDAALDSFKKADKQDGGQCKACQQQIIKYGTQLHEWKAAESAAEELLAAAKEKKDVAIAHYQFGLMLLEEGIERRKDDPLNRAHEELGKALEIAPKFPLAILADGRALAFLKRDEEAKARFVQFVEMKKEDSPERQRAMLYIAQPELARALMAPPFTVTTLDGKQISLDDLQGKVVLIDFWATWCGPCREALPHVRDIARKFDGQPLVVLSVSVDTDESKWKEFVAKNEMTWPQYFDHGFTGPVAKSFGVHAIPNTFTIDADGVLQDEHIGDAAIEGKLKKLVKRAAEKQAAKAP
ncbi:MAG TPA: TlpA disulfide reductase family protein [Candidatus Dormibacteraeota bacterium]|nr:TlpA disulfide reductase family protein [Candidatus Dormibacteraeota bacterium]